jgi:hypothetical protein
MGVSQDASNQGVNARSDGIERAFYASECSPLAPLLLGLLLG